MRPRPHLPQVLERLQARLQQQLNLGGGGAPLCGDHLAHAVSRGSGPRIFCGHVPPECTEELVKAHFSQWGHVMGACVLCSSVPLGCEGCWVRVAARPPALLACAPRTLLRLGLRRRARCRTRLPRRPLTNRTMLTNSPPHPPPPLPPAADVYFPKRKDTFRRRPFCFVTFVRLEDAQRALAESPMNICGIPIKQLNLVEDRSNYYAHRHQGACALLLPACLPCPACRWQLGWRGCTAAAAAAPSQPHSPHPVSLPPPPLASRSGPERAGAGAADAGAAGE